MIIYTGADHRGLKLKETIKKYLDANRYTVSDVGAYSYNENDDYPDFAKEAVEKAVNEKDSVAIVICGSGIGVDIVANKIKGARSALCFSVEQAKASRRDDDANVLSLSADYLDKDRVISIVDVWLKTEFSGEEKYIRRIEKIKDLEK